MRNMIITFSALAGLFLLTGCATSFQANKLDEVSAYPKVKNKATVYVNLVFSGKVNGEAWTQNDKQNQKYLKQRCMDTLNESGMFSFVSDGLKSTDLHLYIAVINDKQNSTSRQVTSALTLFLYPYTETDSFRTMALLKQPSTGKEFKFSLDDEVKHRQALLLAPLAPFKPSGNALEKCTDRIFKNLCVEIHRTGLVK